MLPDRLMEAVEIARSCKDKKTFRLGCVAKRQDGVIVKSVNGTFQPKGLIVTAFGEKIPEGHSEVRVLRKAGIGAMLWVARVRADGTIAKARPCPTCRAIILNHRVSKVYYTIANDEYGIWSPEYDVERVKRV